MTAEYITALASVGTLLVIAVTALAAFVQLRHMRTSNVLMVLNDFREAFERPEMSASRDALPQVLARLQDRESRRELSQEKLPEWALPVGPLLRLFETLGAYTNRNVVPRDLICDMWSPVVLGTWTMSAPLIAVMRRSRGPALFENFEMLAVLSQRWLDEKHEVYPRNLPRMNLADPWAEEDGL
jgi:flagellar motor component MotA